MHVCDPTVFDALLRSYFIATITGVVRRDVLGESIRFTLDPAYSEEWLFYLQVTRTARCGFVDEPLCVHHFTPGSVSRTDRSTNLSKFRILLHSMIKMLHPLTRSQRRTLRDHLAHACRQLAYDSYREDRYADAASYFAEVLRAQPSFVGLYHLTDSVFRAIRHRVGRNARERQRFSQDAVDVIR
jgi:hypothetical protein